jgi:hypothetical protein
LVAEDDGRGLSAARMRRILVLTHD